MSKPRTPRTSGPKNPASIRLPADVIQAGNDALDQMDALLDPDGPPTDREPPSPLSALSVRLTDGALFCSLEDAKGCDLTGRTVVSFLLLNDAEILKVRRSMDYSLADAAASVVGALPRRKA